MRETMGNNMLLRTAGIHEGMSEKTGSASQGYPRKEAAGLSFPGCLWSFYTVEVEKFI